MTIIILLGIIGVFCMVAYIWFVNQKKQQMDEPFDDPLIKTFDICMNLPYIDNINVPIEQSNFDKSINMQFYNLPQDGNTKKLLPYTKYDVKFNPQYYDSNNYNLMYHDSIDTVMEGTAAKLGKKGTWVKGKDGKIQYVEWKDIPLFTTYDPPGNFPFGPSNYVPSYNDAALLSFYRKKRNINNIN
jgi:hypothetical protein